MGIYLNPGCRAFEEALHTDIFIDKTEMIIHINSVLKTKRKYVSISRPRRFGKTMAADMLCAYYGKSNKNRALFEDTKLSRYDDWDAMLGKFNVIRLTMTDFIKKGVPIEQCLTKIQKLLTRDIKKQYPDIDYFDENDLCQSMLDIYSEKDQQFIIIIDEWDAIFRTRKNDKEGQTEYLNFLRDWLKDKEYVALAYMTGILPIKKYGEHSALNMFTEYSMTQPMQLAPFTGFTEEEVRELCDNFGRNYEMIKEWYDGYIVSGIIPPDPGYKQQLRNGAPLPPKKYALYSPLSVVNAISTGQIRNYWNKTETYEALAEYIRMNLDGLKDAVVLMMAGGRVKIDTSKFQNDMTTFQSRDDILTLLVHLGYLGFDDENGEAFIPNKEILDEFKSSTDSEDWTPVFQAFKTSHQLLEATWAGDEEKPLTFWNPPTTRQKTRHTIMKQP